MHLYLQRKGENMQRKGVNKGYKSSFNNSSVKKMAMKKSKKIDVNKTL